MGKHKGRAQTNGRTAKRNISRDRYGESEQVSATLADPVAVAVAVEENRQTCRNWLIVGVGMVTTMMVPFLGFYRGKGDNTDFSLENIYPDLGPSKSMFELGPQVQVSLFETYAMDFREVSRTREKNMRKYSYNYSRNVVDKRSNLTMEEFWDVYDGKWPVIVTDVVPQWSAYNWSRDFLFQHFGKERVTMKAVDNGLENAVSLALPLELFYKNTLHAYPRQWTYIEDELFIPMRPKLRQDIGDCLYLDEDFYQLFPDEVRPWNAMLLWGTMYSRSSLHIDPYNWTGTNAVFKGRKRWKLYPPGQDHLLYVENGRMSGFPLDCYKYNSPVDSFEPNVMKYPKFDQAQYIEVDQMPGEIMFIPTGWLHQAFNMEETIAVSSQMMNRNNYRIVLEEIFKAKNVKREQLPDNIDDMSPAEQVEIVMSHLPQKLLDHGRHVTADAIRQIKTVHKPDNYQMPFN